MCMALFAGAQLAPSTQAGMQGQINGDSAHTVTLDMTWSDSLSEAQPDAIFLCPITHVSLL